MSNLQKQVIVRHESIPMKSIQINCEISLDIEQL